MNYLLKKVLLCSLLLCALGQINAQTKGELDQDITTEENCDLPAPVNLTINESGSEYFLLSWDPVPGAAHYRVVVTDVLSGVVEINDFAYTTDYMAVALTPGREYGIQVAGVCENGMDGLYSNVRFHVTGVVIVDIVIRFTEDDCTLHTEARQNNINNNWTRYFYSIELDESLSLSGTSPSNSHFNVAIKHVGGRPDALIGFLGSQGSGIELSQGSGKKTISDSSSPLFNLDIITSNNPTAGDYIVLELDNSIPIDVKKCLNVAFQSEGRGSRTVTGNKHRTLRQTNLAPNPTNSLVNIKISQDTPLEIFDVRGQQWYSKIAIKGSALTIDASQWPAGTYFVRTIENDIPIINRFVKH